MKKNINVYFNRCFTDTSRIINQLKENTDNIKYKIFISHPGTNQILKESADYYEEEPVFKSISAYVNYCLDFCLKNHIDIFVPRYRVEELVKFKEKFEEKNIKILLVGDTKIYELINNKTKIYEDLYDGKIINIPPYAEISSYNDFRKKYREIKDTGFNVCIKPVIGIGGEGFKKIVEDLNLINSLYLPVYAINFDTIQFILKKEGTFSPLLISGYLSGDEYSIDCLADKGKIIDAIPRVKKHGYQVLEPNNKELINIAVKIADKYKLDNLFNIQVKYHNNKPYLIEINTRMSAGIFKAGLSGINFLHKAIMKEFGVPIQSQLGQTREVKVKTIKSFEVI